MLINPKPFQNNIHLPNYQNYLFMKLIAFNCLFFLTLLLSNALKAQSPNFTASEELIEARSFISLFLSNDEVVFYGTNTNGLPTEGMDIYMYRLKSTDLTNSLKRVAINSVSYRTMDYEKRFSLDDKQIIFYTNKAKQNGELMLSYQITENSSLKPGEIKEISLGVKKWDKGKSSPTTTEFMYSGNDYNYNFEEMMISKNKDKFIYTDNIEDPDAGMVSRVIVINAQTMQIEKEMTFDLGINKLGIGGVYHNDFLYSIVEVSPGKDVNENNYYKLIALSLKKETKSFVYDLKFEGKTVETCGFDIAPNGDILISGISSNTAKKHYQLFVDDIFFHRLDGVTGNMISESDTKLDLKTIQFLNGKPNSTNVEKVSARFELIKFYPLNNGSINIIMEEASVEFGLNSCNSLLVANINKNGEFNWIKHIPKKQEREDFSSKLISYSHRIDGSKLTLVYMDNKNNYDSKTNMILPDKMLSAKNVKTATKSSNAMAIVTIEENGNIIQKLLADAGNYSCYSQNVLWNKTGDEIYFLTLRKNNILNLSKIKIN